MKKLSILEFVVVKAQVFIRFHLGDKFDIRRFARVIITCKVQFCEGSIL